MAHPTPNPGTVFVLDDNESLRSSILGLLQSVGRSVHVFSSPSEFLAFPPPEEACCLILDIELAGEDGLSFQQELIQVRPEMPVVVITGHASVDRSVQALKAGAIDFLMKPFSSEALLLAVESCLRLSNQRRSERILSEPLRSRYATLTPRERQVFQLVVSGLPNKQIAGVLATQEITVKIHRGKVMRKMGAGSLVDLVRMADRLEVKPVEPS